MSIDKDKAASMVKGCSYGFGTLFTEGLACCGCCCADFGGCRADEWPDARESSPGLLSSCSLSSFGATLLVGRRGKGILFMGTGGS